MSETFKKGALYIISTPIGNMEDITLRALRLLKSVDLIAAEDTRHTKHLLSKYDIPTILTSYHDHNKEEKTPVLVERLKEGQSIGLVCDAGTPGISDPGFYLIRRCAEEGIPTIPIPGPTAAMAALVASGLPTDSFLFVGFLPKKHVARLKRLALLKDTPATLIFYESPYRVAKALQDYLEVLGNRQAVIARELTKVFEELMRGSLEELLARLQAKTCRGEITLIIEGQRSEKR
jgi:16S rRNA (cytidine1402-2'-O)-methyltransferase